MTVKELIDELTKFPDEMEVMIWHWDNDWPGYNEAIDEISVVAKMEKNLLSGREDTTQVLQLKGD